MYLMVFFCLFILISFTLWLFSGALLFECITVNKGKLWNSNADSLVFVLYLGCTFKLMSVTYLSREIQNKFVNILNTVYFPSIFFCPHLLVGFSSLFFSVGLIILSLDDNNQS